MKPWSDTIRVVLRADGQTVDVFKGDDLLLTAKFPAWPPTPDEVEQLRRGVSVSAHPSSDSYTTSS